MQTANYIKDLKKIALNAGWEPGTPLIDLTGWGCGANVILGGRILGSPWLMGGKKGSKIVAKYRLNMIPKSELETAWILTAQSFDEKIPEDILPEIGLNFPKGYKVVGTVKGFKVMGPAIPGNRDVLQVLWKPLNHHAGESDVGL